MSDTEGSDSKDSHRDNRKMLLNDKMAALGRLAASVAHEVRNPLGAIDIQLQLLQEELLDGRGSVQRAGERLDTARAELHRLDSIVQNFLRFSRPPTLHLSRMSLAHLFARLSALIAPEARERGIQLTVSNGDQKAICDGDENLLSQAFLNILINALQAFGGANLSANGPASVVVELDTCTDGHTLVTIVDNGCGVPADDLEKIFEYYYTTKDTGTGLGLSIAQRIIHQHRGSLEVESEDGTGTTVSIRLPRAAQESHP